VKRFVVQSGPITGLLALLLLLLFVAVLAASVVFGMLAFAAVSLVALALHLVGGKSSRHSVERQVDAKSGRIIDSSYRVLSEGPAPKTDESTRARP
jgi:hypothetical protein